MATEKCSLPWRRLATKSIISGYVILMQIVGIEAMYCKPNTSKPAPGHRIYPYLLRGLAIIRVHQVWATDITYIPMKAGYMYLIGATRAGHY